MHISILVNAGRHRSEQDFSRFHPGPQQVMASSLQANPYTVQPRTQTPPPPYSSYITAPQPPPSPPMDEASRCSLPSISSLLGSIDGSSPQEPSQPQQQAQQMAESRPGSGHQYGPSPSMSSRGALPPTPPMQSESGFDGRQSPSAASSSGYSVVSASGYYFSPNSASAINNMEPHAQRQHIPALNRRVSMPAASMPYNQSPFNGSQYTASPSQQSMGSYYSSPMQLTPPQSQISGLYYQRPLPQQFPPPVEMSVTLTHSSGANPWQHHHYISQSSAAAFPQTQDRYVCTTCNKAFSRPSSLKIHSHSHTGEKPFKCPYPRCGKPFSVRSNMKRHERGCHTDR